MFVVLSISDIGVGAISMPALGVLSSLWNNLLDSFNNDTLLPFAMTVICYDFPYTFFYLTTTTIAVDRFFIVTKQKKYENFITIKRLVYIVILLLLLAFLNCFVLCYVTPLNYGNVKSTMRKTYLIVNIISMLIILSAYCYILFFVWRQSNAMKTCRHSHAKYNKRITKAILYIFICQIICTLPCLIMHIVDEFGGSVPVLLVAQWLSILRNSQCLCDGLVILHSEKQKIKSKKDNPTPNTELV